MPSAIDNQPVGSKLWSWMQSAQPAQGAVEGLPDYAAVSERAARARQISQGNNLPQFQPAYGLTNTGTATPIPRRAAEIERQGIVNQARDVPNEPWLMSHENVAVPGAAAPARLMSAQEDTGRGLPMPVVKYVIPEDVQAGQNDLAERLAKSGVSLGSLIKLMGVMPHAQKPARNPFADDAGRLAAAAARSAYDEVWNDPKASVDAKRNARTSYLNTMTSLARGNPQAAAVANLIGQ